MPVPAARDAHTGAVRNARSVVAIGLVLVEAALAGLAVVLHYGLTAEYGDVTDSAAEAWRDAFVTGTGLLAVLVVGVVAVVAAVATRRPGWRALALSLPVVMAVAMLAATPLALRHKLETQYDTAPRCVPQDDGGAGRGSRAARDSQRAFDSIDHVGYFGRGGASGVAGCDRLLVLTEQVDVLAHYRSALAAAGWRVVESRDDALRAERAGMAFVVSVCGRGGSVWAGERSAAGQTGCGRDDGAVTGSP